MLDAEGVKALSTMPSLPELRAKLLGLLKAPAASWCGCSTRPAGQLARVLKAHQEKAGGQVGLGASASKRSVDLDREEEGRNG